MGNCNGIVVGWYRGCCVGYWNDVVVQKQEWEIGMELYWGGKGGVVWTIGMAL